MADMTKAQKRDSILTDERVIQLFRVRTVKFWDNAVVQWSSIWGGAILVILAVGHLPAP